MARAHYGPIKEVLLGFTRVSASLSLTPILGFMI